MNASSPLAALLAAVAAAVGVHLLWTAAHGERRIRVAPARRVPRRAARDWMVQAGLADVNAAEFVGVMGALAVVGAVLAYAIFGGILPSLVAALFAATFPPATYRRRRAARMAKAQESWPRMIEEIRILTGSLGRSIPQALFDVGRRGPEDLRPAFAAAHREWLLSTDFERTLRVLKDRLADPAADAACETLLIAHELGGADLDRRLGALAEDRMQDTQGRKDARAKQAGVCFANPPHRHRSAQRLEPRVDASTDRGLGVGSPPPAARSVRGTVGVRCQRSIASPFWAASSPRSSATLAWRRSAAAWR